MGKAADRTQAQSDAATWIETVPPHVKAMLLRQWGPVNTWAIHTVRSMQRQYPTRRT